MIKLTQMSILPGVRKVFDVEATEVSGNSRAEDFLAVVRTVAITTLLLLISEKGATEA